MEYCLLCGSGYAPDEPGCPGPTCGADLVGQRVGGLARAVRAWCDPARITAAPGETVAVSLTVWNAGGEPDRYELEVPGEAADRIRLERPGPPGHIPGARQIWTLLYTVPVDPAPASMLGPGGLFGLDALDGGSAYEETAREVDVFTLPLRVVSSVDPRIGALAPLDVRVVMTDQEPVAGYPDVEEPPGDARGRPGRAVAVGFAAVSAVVIALLVGMAVARPGDDSGRGAAPGPSASASGAVSASPSATESSVGASASASPEETASPSSSSPSATRSTAMATVPRELTVPDVTGMTEAEGMRALRAAGFRPSVMGSGGTIASTRPAAGSRVERADAAVLLVMSGAAESSPPTGVEMPGVVGLSFAEAEARLRAVGLRAARIERDSARPAGTVLDSLPSAGRPVEPGATVQLWVARRRGGQTGRVSVPDLDGMTRAQAASALRSARLDMALSDPDATGGSCRVDGQWPFPGAWVAEGTSVTVDMACRGGRG